MHATSYMHTCLCIHNMYENKYLCFHIYFVANLLNIVADENMCNDNNFFLWEKLNMPDTVFCHCFKLYFNENKACARACQKLVIALCETSFCIQEKHCKESMSCTAIIISVLVDRWLDESLIKQQSFASWKVLYSRIWSIHMTP